MKNIGKIIKLNRIQLDIKQEYFINKKIVSQTQLSRIEGNKLIPSHEQAKKLFESMDIQYCEDDIYDQFEKDFLTFYRNIAYDDVCEEAYQKLLSYDSQIRSTVSYPKYLLVKMIYAILFSDVQDIKQYTFLENYFEYLESYQIQLYYIYLGIYFRRKRNYQNSLDNYETAEQYKGNQLSKSMLYYHKSIAYRNLGFISQSYHYIQEAKSFFVDQVNLKRIVSSEFQIAIIEAARNHYDKAIEKYFLCIKAFQQLNMIQNMKSVYNNILWTYIRAKKYEEIIQFIPEVLKVRKDGNIYFYISFAYYQLNQLSKAKEYIHLAKNSCNQVIPYMNSMIQTLYVLIYSHSFDKKEKNLFMSYDKALETHDQEVIIFVLELLIDFYYQYGKIHKAYEYQNILLKHYQTRS